MSVKLSSPPWPEFLKLLAHEVRWNILALLARSDYRVQEIVQQLKQPQNLVSYHLRLLSEQHVVTERRSDADGRDIYYSLDVETLRTRYFAAAASLHPAFSLLEPALSQPERLARLDHPVRVLFLCTENSARSQMAEGILRHLSGGQVECESAGTRPADVHPEAIHALAKLGIDIRQQRSKHLDQFRDHSFDYIVTVCDRVRESCPTWPGETEPLHWSLPDPAALEQVTPKQRAEAFEQVALELLSRIRTFLVVIEQSSTEIR